jgi:hypothetical protein
MPALLSTPLRNDSNSIVNNHNSNKMMSFHDRLKAAAIGDDGYKPYKRRPIQTVLLYETHRSLKDILPRLSPFQRKIAVYVQFNKLLNIECATFLLPVERSQIGWTTIAAKKVLTPDAMMLRMRLAVKEVEEVAVEVTAFAERYQDVLATHEEIYNAFVQHRFVRSIYDR